MTYKEIIDAVLSATLDNGKMVVRKLEQRVALEKIRDFDLQADWMEQKELTKTAKLLGAFLIKIYPDLLPQNDKAYKGFNVYPNDFVPANLRTAYLHDSSKHFAGSPVEYRKSKAVFENAAKIAEQLWPLADHFEAMKKRTLRNGRLPKEEADRIRKEEIKGSLDPDLNREITRLRNKWHPIIYENALVYWKEQRANAIVFLERMNWKDPVSPKRSDKDSLEEYKLDCGTFASYFSSGIILEGSYESGKKYSTCKDRVLEDKALYMADRESESFYFKMADKLGGFVTDMGKSLKSVKDWDAGRATPFESTIRFTFNDGSNFLLKNSIVASRSVNNTFFFRYPATFHDAYSAKGQKIANPDEYSVKAAFLEDVGVRKRKL